MSDGWYKYYDFRINPEDIICDGCLSGDDPILIDKNCPVRPCVISKGLDHCASCKEYICEKLAQRIVDYDELSIKFETEIPEDDHDRFIRPYESKKRLDEVREHLNQ